MTKILISAILICSADNFAKEVKQITQNELTQVFRKCSLANPSSTSRRIAAENFIKKVDKAAFECKRLAYQEEKNGYKNRATMLKAQAKTMKEMVEDMKRNKKLETGRITDTRLEEIFDQHNKTVALLQPSIVYSTVRSMETAAKSTGSFLAKNKGAMAITSLLALASAATFVLGYAASEKGWNIPLLKDCFADE